jgi:hypothetical protein
MFDAYFKPLIGKKRGIPESERLFSVFVEGTCKVSNLLEDIQALEDKNKLLKNMMETLPDITDNE